MGLPAAFSYRPIVILFVSSTILLPLCSLESLHALTPVSLVGLWSTLLTVLVIAYRSYDGSYRYQGAFYANIVLKPSFLRRSIPQSLASPKIFVLISRFCSTFHCHYTAPLFYNELKGASASRFNQVVSYSYGIAVPLAVLVMVCGFLTFGGSSLGCILNNYSENDILVIISRFAIGFTLVTSFPFPFSGLRAGIFDVMGINGRERDDIAPVATLILLVVCTVLALVLHDVGFVVSLSGALFGCIIMFVVPMMMNVMSMLKSAAQEQKSIDMLDVWSQIEIYSNCVIILLGFALSIAGALATVLRELHML